MDKNILISFVIPCYNSGNVISLVVNETTKEMRRLQYTNFEFILVNDCSPDGGKTIETLNGIVDDFENVKVINLAKNAGQHNAVLAGLHYAKGEIIVGMDDDMQTHPSQLEKLLKKYNDGYDIVYGYYEEKKHSFLRNVISKLNYYSVRILIGKPKELKTSSFWVIKKYVRDYLIQYQFTYPYLQGMFLAITKNIACVPVKHFERIEGQSNYTFKRLFKLWSGIIGFSIVPLRLAFILGAVFSLFGLVGCFFAVFLKLFNPNILVGWASLFCIISFFGGLIMLFLGLIGEYIGRIFLIIGKEPQYVVKEIIER